MTSNNNKVELQRVLAWVGNPPAHWKIDRLKWSVAGLFNGVWGEEPNGEEDIICVRVADFDRTRFTVVDTPPTIRAVQVKERTNRTLRRGDLLIEKSGGGDNQPVGCVVHFDHAFDAVCSNFVGRMPVATGMHPRYWSYVHASLYAGRINIPAIKQTTGIQNLDADVYLNNLVPFPPFEEQCKIADYLDRETARIDGLIAAKERVLSLMAEKRRALITRAVTCGLDPKAPLCDSGIPWLGKIPKHWEVWKLAHLADIGNGSTPSRENVGYWSDGSIPWLNSSVVNQDEVIESDQFITKLALKECHLPMVQPGSVLVGITGQGKTRGQAVVLSFESTINQHLAFVAPDPSKMDSWFLRWIFSAAYDYIRAISDDAGGTKGALTCEELADMKVFVPPFAEQHAIVAHVAAETGKLDAMRMATEKTIGLLKERRSALITAAVTGRIDLSNKK